MSTATENLAAAQAHAMEIRPAVGGFPVLAEVLRRAGVVRNDWHLPSAQSLYLTDAGPVVQQGAPLTTGTFDVPAFDEAELIRVLRADQAGQTSLPEFLTGAWQAGVVSYTVDFAAREVTYYGADGSSYLEAYPAVSI